jgi:hypothetical protein
MLYNGGHADSKDRVGEKHGVRGAERGLYQRHQDGDCQVKSGPISQRTAMCALNNFWQYMPRACSVSRRDYSTLYRCFNCYPLRRHCGVDFVLQFLKISSDRHKIKDPWHRLALVDLVSAKLCPIFFSIDM